MTKRLNILTGALSALVMAGGLMSCSNDTFFDEPSGDGTVTFTANIADQAATRALSNYGDGSGANKLWYAVYDEDGNLVMTNSKSAKTYPVQVTLQLTKGIKYDIVFFAGPSTNSSPYKFVAEDAKVTVDYAKLFADNSGYRYSNDTDCFFEVKNGYVGGSSSQENVVLTRPTAQLNFGSDDIDSDVVKNFYKSTPYSSIKVNACKTLNLITGEGEDSDEITLNYMRLSDLSKLTYPVDGYEYLATAYLLLGKSQTIEDVTLRTSNRSGDPANITPLKELTITNVPLQRNYRTNIYGSLLTSSSEWNISFEEIKDLTNILVWDGSAEDPIVVDENNYLVNTPAQLAGLAKMVNGGNDLAGKTVTLGEDLDLGNRNWTPIGTTGHPFNGKFDGDGHTIRNLSIVTDKNFSGGAGLFGVVNSNGKNRGKIQNFTVDGAEINVLASLPSISGAGAAAGWIYTSDPVEKVTVKNVNIQAYHYAGGVVGKGYGSVNDCVAENVTITLKLEKMTSGTQLYDNADKAGGIIGQQDEGGYTLSGNVARNINLTGYRHLGGIAGYVNYGRKEGGDPYKFVEDNHVYGVRIAQDFTYNYKNITAGEKIAGTFGEVDERAVQLDNNTAESVELVLPTIVTDVQSLIKGAQTGGVVTLGTDLDLRNVDGQIDITKPTVLELNGKTIKLKSHSLNVEDEFVVRGEGQLESDGFTIIGAPGSTIVIEDGEVVTTGSEESAINTNGNLVINGGVIKSVNNCAVTLNWPNVYEPQEVVINGGTFVTLGSDNAVPGQKIGNYSLNIHGGSQDVGHRVTINGGTFVGRSGARADAYVTVEINDGIFIQEATNSTGHAFCAGAQMSATGTEVIIRGGYFYGGNGYALCQAGTSNILVLNAYVNKLKGGYALGDGATENTLTTPVVKVANGKSYSFGYQIR